jgi:hypothetical protein
MQEEYRLRKEALEKTLEALIAWSRPLRKRVVGRHTRGAI